MTDAPNLVSITSDGLSAEIDPVGAELHALRDFEGRDLLWDGDAAIWSGRAPVLFPIVGALANGCYRLDGNVYPLPKHGFARHSLFQVIERSLTSATFRLCATAETMKVYPFPFQLDLTFAVEHATLSITALVRNAGAAAMPASFGFHPALRWPLPYGAARADHGLTFPEDEPAPIRRIDHQGVLLPDTFATPVVDRRLALKDALFGTDAVIFDRLNSQSVAYGAYSGPTLEVAFPDTPYLGVWTKPGAPYICIEPWHGIADPRGFDADFRDKPGVFEVGPGAARRFTLTISLNS